MEDAQRVRLLQNLHDLQPAYKEAVKHAQDVDGMGERLYELWRDLGSFNPNDPPSKAIYLVAKCCANLESFGREYAAIHDYREAQERLEKYDMRKALENG